MVGVWVDGSPVEVGRDYPMIYKLGGGFKDWERIQFGEYFSNGLKPPTRFLGVFGRKISWRVE